MIAVENVTHCYGRLTALRDVSFELARDEVVGLLGLNGAGKSTLVRILTGCVRPTRGVVRIGGADIEDVPSARRAIGYLPETPPLHPEMTVVEYLRYVARLKDVPRARRGAETGRVMGRVALGGVSGRLVQNLSKGYRQRVGIAQALLGDPPLLILDEPTVGLDPAQMDEIRSLVAECSEGRTVLFSSHILSEVSAVCDRVAILNRGRLAAFERLSVLCARAEGAPSLRLRVAGGGKALIRAVAAVDGVAGVRETDPAEGDIRSLAIECRDGDELRRRVALAVRDCGGLVLEMHAPAPAPEIALAGLLTG